MSVSNNDDLTVGIELEYPVSQESRTTFQKPAQDSRHVEEEIYRPDWHPAGEIVYDGTAGAEAVSPALNESAAEGWFTEALNEFKTYAPYEPCGFAASVGRASSFGLHIHLSSLTEREAVTLADFSSEPWLQLLVCSSIAKDDSTETYQVFRDNYCNLNFDERRYSVVNHRRDGHYEWRLPEPMTEANFSLMMDFLRKFKHDSPSEAATWAKGIVESADRRLTSVQRIQEIGLEAIVDEPNEDCIVPEGVDLFRSAYAHTSSNELFESINDNHERPYIYRVEVPSEGVFFGFATNRYDDTEEFEDGGLTYTVNDVIDADKQLLERDRETIEIVNQAIENQRSGSSSGPAKSRATEKLASIVNE